MRRAGCVLLLIGLLAPFPAVGAQDDTGSLSGAVRLSGVGTPGIEVSVWRRAGTVPAFPLPADHEVYLHPEWLLDAALLPGPPLARTLTGKDGAFEVPDLEKGRYLVVATTPEGSRSWREISLFSEGDWSGLVIDVVPGSHVLRGRARYRDGAPFRGAIVLSHGVSNWPDGSWTQLLGGAICDAEGRFEMRGLPTGFLSVTAVAPGRFRALLGPVLLPFEGPLDLVVDEQLAITAGTLVDASGQPVVGVRLLAGSGGVDPDYCRIHAGAVTGPDGRFRMLGPLDPQFRIVGSDRYLSRVEARGPASGQLELVATERPRVSGVVRRAEDGAPLAGIPVLALSTRERGEPPMVVLTDPEGKFQLLAPDLDIILAAWGRGWVPRDRSNDALTYSLAAGEEREVVLEMERAARVTGLVQGPGGKPAPGVSIHTGYVFSEDAEDLIPGSFFTPTTDDEGRFTLDFLPVGTAAAISALGDRGFAQEDVSTTGAAEEELIISRTARESSLGGRVALPAGATGLDFRVSQVFRLDVDGRFELHSKLPEVVRAAGFVGDVFYRGEAPLIPGRELVVSVEPASPETAFVLHVRGPDGRPVPAGECVIKRSEGRGRAQLKIVGGRVWYCDLSGRDGPPGTIEAEIHSCRDARGRPLALAPMVAGPLEPGVSIVRLSPGRVVEGVAATPDGRPVRGLEVVAYARSEDGKRTNRKHADVVSGIDGRFRLAGLGRGAYDVSFVAPLAFVTPEILLLPGDATELRVEVIEKVAPRVTVLSPAGDPIAGAVVRLDAPDTGEPYVGGRLQRTTSEDGAAVFPMLDPDAPVLFRVTPPDGGSLSQADWGWRPADVTIRLRRAVSLRGRVVDAAGRAVPDATVFLRPTQGSPPLPEDVFYSRIEGGYVLAAIADENGSFKIDGLPETTVQAFAAVVSENGTEVRSATLEAQTGATGLVFRLP